jgi:predicted nucleotidyltransferase
VRRIAFGTDRPFDGGSEGRVPSVQQERAVPGIALGATTGDVRVDDVLRGLVGAFEAALPGRLRACYVVGSYADGTATLGSDLDVYVVIREDFRDGDEERRAAEVLRGVRAASPVALDVIVKGERVSIAFGEVDLKLRSLVVYGEDVRDRIPLLPMEVGARGAMHFQVPFLARTRGNPPTLSFPMGAPDPDGAFLGYDRRVARGAEGVERATTKDMVRAVLGAASALVAWRAGEYVPHKGAAAGMYRALVSDDAWAELLEEVDCRCRIEWGYLMPEGTAERRRLRELCEGVLRFENEFLATYREMLLANLARADGPEVWLPLAMAPMVLGGTPAEVRERAERRGLLGVREACEGVRVPGFPAAFAARMAPRVRYPDGAVARALRALAGAEDLFVREAAEDALARIGTGG